MFEERKNRNRLGTVNIEANGRAIGMKRSGMTLLPWPSAICNWLGPGPSQRLATAYSRGPNSDAGHCPVPL